MLNRFRSNFAAVKEIVNLLREMYAIADPFNDVAWDPNDVRHKLRQIRQIERDHADSFMVRHAVILADICSLEESLGMR